MRKVIAIAGPTASGKSSLSVKLAKEIGAEIISTDAVQVYKGLDIGSAKVTKEEMSGIRHYMIDEVNPDVDFNVNLFLKKALYYIDEIFKKGKDVIVVGGSMLYTDSLMYDSYDFPKFDENVRKELEDIYKKKGKEFLYNILEKVDMESAIKIHKNNVKRVIRAIEIYKNTGIKKSEIDKRNNKFRFDNTYYYFLNANRKRVYERIDKRVDEMIECGLVEEVEGLLKIGYDEKYTSMNSLGYKQIIDYLKGKCSLEEAIYIIKRDTRHFAKRQYTWYNAEKRKSVKKIDFENIKDALDIIKGDIKWN